jgi:hypothetical protein
VPTLRFLVRQDQADDPETDTLVEWSAAQIREYLPQFATLFPDKSDDTFPSLVYTADVYRCRIEPLAVEYIAEQEAERARRELERWLSEDSHRHVHWDDATDTSVRCEARHS